MISRPARTAVHVEREALLAQFRDVGLVPVVSTNGSIPDADIQQAKGAKPGELIACWLTMRGKIRLDAARLAQRISQDLANDQIVVHVDLSAYQDDATEESIALRSMTPPQFTGKFQTK